MAQSGTERGAPASGLRGLSIIAGEWAEPSGQTFHAVDPARGREIDVAFHPATDEDVDAACWQAWEAYFAGHAPDARAAMLDAAADGIVALGDHLISTAASETGLGPVRLVSERERTTSTLRMFAQIIRDGDWVDASIDTAEPSRRPVARPDLRSMLRPLGPVGVFPPSNFPLAYSVAGGDSASAMAAGCPVIVKGHPSHPGTSELVATAVAEAVEKAGLHPGYFSLLQSGGDRAIAVGEALVKHPCVRAIGFTGSWKAGTALVRLGAERQDPIPVYAEMGSVNPVFVLDGAVRSHGETIAERLAESVRSANGQMCTCPGLVFAVRGIATETLTKTLATAFNEARPETMLSPNVRDLYIERAREVADTPGVEIRGGSPMGGHRERASGLTGDPIRASAVLFRTDLETFRAHAHLRDEVFGPATMVVACDDTKSLVDAAAMIQGSLTGTIWASGHDTQAASRLRRVLEQRVGRLIFNGVPTGVEVCESMTHGGPYPSSSDGRWTAVGPRAIRRWVRPVSYQNAPDAFLPPELKSSNPLGIYRTVNGERTDGPVARGH